MYFSTFSHLTSQYLLYYARENLIIPALLPNLCSHYYANIIGSGLVFEAGGVVGETPQKYVGCLFVAAPQKL